MVLSAGEVLLMINKLIHLKMNCFKFRFFHYSTRITFVRINIFKFFRWCWHILAIFKVIGIFINEFIWAICDTYHSTDTYHKTWFSIIIIFVNCWDLYFYVELQTNIRSYYSLKCGRDMIRLKSILN